MNEKEKRQMARENRSAYETIQALAPIVTPSKKTTPIPIAELSEDELARLMAAKSRTADRLMATLNGDLNPAELKQTLDRLETITVELKQGHDAQREQARQAVIDEKLAEFYALLS